MPSPSTPAANPSIAPEHRRANADQFCTAKPIKSSGVDITGKSVEAALASCVAKVTYDPNTDATRYWVKQATSNGGEFYNPQSPSFDDVPRRGSLARAIGKELYEFRTVSKEQYDLYLRFLATGNQAYVREAERLY